jgi:hypothetical protein
MDRKEAIKLVYGDKAVEDYEGYEYRLPCEATRRKPVGCEVWRPCSKCWCEAKAGQSEMHVWYFYRWPKQQKRWFFCPECKITCIDQDMCDCFTVPLEVTESYARYLQNKPEGVECELRMVKGGDEYWATTGVWDTARVYFAVRGKHDLGYRWVKTESLKIVDVVGGMCNGEVLILGLDCGIKDHYQAQYIYDNGQESPHSWLWKNPGQPASYSARRDIKFHVSVTPVKVVCARRGR